MENKAFEQLAAFTMAHRVLLAYVVKALRVAAPAEADAKAIDATASMLHQSLPRVFADLAAADPALADRLTALAQQEVDRILLAPTLPAPPSSPP